MSKKLKTMVSTAIMLTFVFTLFNFNTVKAAATPTPVISGLQTSYMPGSKIDVKVTSSGYTKNVQYRVFVYNYSTKKFTEITKGYSGNINYKTAFAVGLSNLAEGKYDLVVHVKRAGYKVAYDKYLKKTFEVKFDTLGQFKKLVEGKVTTAITGNNVTANITEEKKGISLKDMISIKEISSYGLVPSKVVIDGKEYTDVLSQVDAIKADLARITGKKSFDEVKLFDLVGKSVSVTVRGITFNLDAK